MHRPSNPVLKCSLGEKAKIHDQMFNVTATRFASRFDDSYSYCILIKFSDAKILCYGFHFVQNFLRILFVDLVTTSTLTVTLVIDAWLVYPISTVYHFNTKDVQTIF